MTKNLHSAQLDYNKDRKKLFRIVRNEEVNISLAPIVKQGRWTQNEHKLFLELVIKYGTRNWKKVTFRNIYFFKFLVRRTYKNSN